MRIKCYGWKQLLTTLILAAAVIAVLVMMPRAVFAEAKAYDLIVPNYDSAYLTEDEIDQMPLQVLCYGKNEIYAQHGRTFASKELAKYFEEQVWYRGTVSPENFKEDVFNAYELANIKALTEKEKELGGYQLDRDGYSFQVIEDYIMKRYQDSSASALAIDSGLTYDSDKEIFSTACFSFSIPEAWIDRWTYTVNSEDSISFCCGKVKANTEMYGTLCTVLRLDEYQAADYFPAADYLGTSGGYYYYLLYPTDVQFSEETAAAYRAMEKGTEEVLSSFRLF